MYATLWTKVERLIDKATRPDPFDDVEDIMIAMFDPAKARELREKRQRQEKINTIVKGAGLAVTIAAEAVHIVKKHKNSRK
jgi:hypothetical protein